MENKIKKILIIGDSNCLPRYNFDNENTIQLEETYIFHLKNKLKDYHFEQLTLGGISTSELINHAIPYYVNWKPDILLLHTGINDTKSQFVKGLLLRIVTKVSLLFNFSKREIKSKILYNPFFLKFYSQSKTDINLFERNLNKIKLLFNESEIFWLEIYSDEKIDMERPNTKKNIELFNSSIKKFFKKNFVELKELKDKKYFTKDGYHLNKNGHIKLADLLIKIFN
jgi:hypothetical protein